ncbi:hypothetical protein Hanom_Chr02g00135641 [Helianthus anomalus]
MKLKLKKKHVFLVYKASIYTFKHITKHSSFFTLINFKSKFQANTKKKSQRTTDPFSYFIRSRKHRKSTLKFT